MIHMGSDQRCVMAHFVIPTQKEILPTPIQERSQSAGIRSKSSSCVEPRPRLATWHMEIVWDTFFFWPPTCSNRFITDILSRTSSLPESKCYRWETTVRDRTGRFVVKSEERISCTSPLPSLARRPSTMNCVFPAEGPQNYIVNQQRLQISELHFWSFHHRFDVCMLEDQFQNPIKFLSQCSSEATLWIRQVEMVESVGDPEPSRSIQGYIQFQSFEMLDARIASALSTIIQNSYFKKKVSMEEQKSQTEDRFFRGRQIVHDLRLFLGYWRSWYRSITLI